VNPIKPTAAAKAQLLETYFINVSFQKAGTTTLHNSDYMIQRGKHMLLDVNNVYVINDDTFWHECFHFPCIFFTTPAYLISSFYAVQNC